MRVVGVVVAVSRIVDRLSLQMEVLPGVLIFQALFVQKMSRCCSSCLVFQQFVEEAAEWRWQLGCC